MYIYQQPNWPNFVWNPVRIVPLLSQVRHAQGRLLGEMASLGFQTQSEATLRVLTEEAVKSSEIEGEILDQEQVRSSIARRLGIETSGLIPSDRHVEGFVEMMLDANRNFANQLSKDRLYTWHRGLFPERDKRINSIALGEWRKDADGPMQVVSGVIGKVIVHFQAPQASLLEKEMKQFLLWFNQPTNTDGVLFAAIAHLWFITIHPFDDGNGRIARAIADMGLARADGTSQRFYSMSAQIRAERREYYEVLERTQKGTLDISNWMEWFLNCLLRATQGAHTVLEAVLKKEKFWRRLSGQSFSERQRKILNLLCDGFDGKLTSSKWGKITSCSQDSAHRDIQDLVEKGILKKDQGGGRSTSYSLVEERTQTSFDRSIT